MIPDFLKSLIKRRPGRLGKAGCTRLQIELATAADRREKLSRRIRRLLAVGAVATGFLVTAPAVKQTVYQQVCEWRAQQNQTLRVEKGIPARPSHWPLTVLRDQQQQSDDREKIVQPVMGAAVITDLYNGDATKYDFMPLFFDGLSSTGLTGSVETWTFRWTFSGISQSWTSSGRAPFGITFSMETTQYGALASYCPDSAGTLTVKLEIWDSVGTYATTSSNFTITANTWAKRYVASAGNGGNDANDGLTSGAPKLLSDVNLQYFYGGDNRMVLVNKGEDYSSSSTARLFNLTLNNRIRCVLTTYGTGADPIIRVATAVADTGTPIMDNAATNLSYIRVDGIKFVATAPATVAIAQAQMSISGTTITVNGPTNNLNTAGNASVIIAGCDQAGYNGTFSYTYTSATIFSYKVASNVGSPTGASITCQLTRVRPCISLSTTGTNNCLKYAITNCTMQEVRDGLTVSGTTNLPEGVLMWNCYVDGVNGYLFYYVGNKACVYGSYAAHPDGESCMRFACEKASIGGNYCLYDIPAGQANGGGKDSCRSRRGGYQWVFLNQFLKGVCEWCWENTTAFSLANECKFSVYEMNYVTGYDTGTVKMCVPNSANRAVVSNIMVRNNVIDQTPTYSTGSNITIDGTDDSTLSAGFTFGAGELTSSGATCTASHTAHGFADKDTVYISGAVQTAYNGNWVITVVDANTFTYVAQATPAASPATGTVLARKVLGGTIRDVQYLHNTLISGPNARALANFGFTGCYNISFKGNLFCCDGTPVNGWFTIGYLPFYAFDYNQYSSQAAGQAYARVNSVNQNWATWTANAQVTNEDNSKTIVYTDLVSPDFRPGASIARTAEPKTTGVWFDSHAVQRPVDAGSATWYAGATDQATIIPPTITGTGGTNGVQANGTTVKLKMNTVYTPGVTIVVPQINIDGGSYAALTSVVWSGAILTGTSSTLILKGQTVLGKIVTTGDLTDSANPVNKVASITGFAIDNGSLITAAAGEGRIPGIFLEQLEQFVRI